MNKLFNYDVAYYERREVRPTFQAEVSAIVAALKLNSSDKVLELGCGSGMALQQISYSHKALLVGLDWLQTSMFIAKEKSQTYSVVGSDATVLPFPDSAFDKIYAQHLIEHFANPYTTIVEWQRVLRKNGRLVVVTPNRRFPYQDWFEDPTHHYIYTGEELAHLFEKAGFEVENWQIVNPFFLHWRFTDLAAKYLQFFKHIPYVGKRGMSILLVATKK